MEHTHLFTAKTIASMKEGRLLRLNPEQQQPNVKINHESYDDRIQRLALVTGFNKDEKKIVDDFTQRGKPLVEALRRDLEELTDAQKTRFNELKEQYRSDVLDKLTKNDLSLQENQAEFDTIKASGEAVIQGLEELAGQRRAAAPSTDTPTSETVTAPAVSDAEAVDAPPMPTPEIRNVRSLSPISTSVPETPPLMAEATDAPASIAPMAAPATPDAPAQAEAAPRVLTAFDQSFEKVRDVTSGYRKELNEAKKAQEDIIASRQAEIDRIQKENPVTISAETQQMQLDQQTGVAEKIAHIDESPLTDLTVPREAAHRAIADIQNKTTTESLTSIPGFRQEIKGAQEKIAKIDVDLRRLDAREAVIKEIPALEARLASLDSDRAKIVASYSISAEAKTQDITNLESVLAGLKAVKQTPIADVRDEISTVEQRLSENKQKQTTEEKKNKLDALDMTRAVLVGEINKRKAVLSEVLSVPGLENQKNTSNAVREQVKNSLQQELASLDRQRGFLSPNTIDPTTKSNQMKEIQSTIAELEKIDSPLANLSEKIQSLKQQLAEVQQKPTTDENKTKALILSRKQNEVTQNATNRSEAERNKADRIQSEITRIVQARPK